MSEQSPQQRNRTRTRLMVAGLVIVALAIYISFIASGVLAVNG